MLALIPADGSDLTLVSLPRDLYLDDPCWGGRQRINAALNGCGDVDGPNLLAIVVEDFTGVPVDHFVLFDFDGFARVIDAAGGVEICVDHDTFDTKTDPDLRLLAGCSTVDGAQALAWVRSRHTLEVVDGAVRTVPGVNDLARNERQRDIVLQLLQRLSDFPNPAELVRIVEAIPDAFTLDDHLSLTAAIGIAWDLRGTPISSVDTPEIPVEFYKAPSGAEVLLPTEPFSETMGWRQA
jgi:LCP family protein required for cell wall assembly